jgi:hypothetical protein
MLKLVSDPDQVKEFYSEFRNLLDSEANFPELLSPFSIRHQGGIAATEARYSPALSIWVCAGSMGWNVFGIEAISSMVVQINFQNYVDETRRTGAAFALDEFQNPIVVHRGHIGGGRPGIGLNLMLENCRSARATLIEADGQQTECFVVGQLRLPLFVNQVADFVNEVKRVKDLTTLAGSKPLAGISDSLFSLNDTGFSNEKSGVSTRAYEGTVSGHMV